jgi:hypothetical protein
MSGESGGCVEVAAAEASVLVRDSRDRPGTTLTFAPAMWRQFVRHIKNGETPKAGLANLTLRCFGGLGPGKKVILASVIYTLQI